MSKNDYGLSDEQITTITDLWETFRLDFEAVVDLALWDSIPGLTALDNWFGDLVNEDDANEEGQS